MFKRLFIVLVLSLSFLFPLKGNNIIGGDITWTCAGTGNFTFKLRLHVQCGGSALPVSYNLNVFNHPTITSIQVNYVGPTDISPTCGSSGTTITCISGGPGAVSEYTYMSAAIALPGVPPPGGWVFTFSDCCRNANTNLSTNATSGITIYSRMFPFSGINMNPCYDNSPDFLSSPETIICNGYQNTLNFFGFDSDLDSISVKWAEPLDDFAGSFTPPVNPVPIAFNTGYSYSNPFPNPATGAGNVAATLDPLSGNISFTSMQTGSFTYALVFESWRCGQKIAEVFKEFQLALSNCGVNPAPTMSAPFSGTYETTVTAGALVSFTLNAGDPAGQNILWEAYSDEFGTGYTNAATGCTQSPCATLNPVPPSPSAGTNSITFNWQTDCAHLGLNSSCTTFEKTYRFYFTAKDDTCPVPAINNKTVIIHVLPPVVLASPPIKCVSVDAASNVTLTWSLTPDPSASFDHYTIYSSPTINGSFTPVATINTYSQTQYTIPAGANVLTNYYIIKAFGCNGFAGSAPADTVRPIFLTVNNPANGTAQLFWNAISNPLPATSCGWYKIYKEYPAGVWSLLDSTQSLNYADTITICQAQLNYRIELCDNSGCNSVSSVDGDVFMDQLDPDIPVLDSVSINSSGDAILGWNPSNAADVVGYIVFQKVGGINVILDTVYGINSTFYTNPFSNASAGTETYLLAAFDSCGNISNLGATQNTIYLSKQYDICGYSTSLSWSAYNNMQDGGIGNYEVLVSVNGTGWVVLGTTTATLYTHSGLIPGNSYCYQIRARSSGGSITSISNRQCVVASTPNQPAYIYLERVTVNSNQNVDVNCYIDNSPTVSMAGIELYRSQSSGGTFEKVQSVAYTGSANYTLTDYSADPSAMNYYYYLMAKDSCDNPSIVSNTSKTILCKAWANENFTNTIVWNDYDMWLGGISSYNIYRSVNGYFEPAPITNVVFTGAGTYTYTDDVQLKTPEEGEFVYYVEAQEGPGNPYGFTATSNSNYAHVYRDAQIFVPNAFVPRGKNTIFLPVTQYVSKTDYQLMIFDRWGQKIWETNDDTVGWTGDGKEGGVYLWIIQYKNSRGEFIEKKGSVTLVR